jgi:spore germination protein YaaH
MWRRALVIALGISFSAESFAQNAEEDARNQGAIPWEMTPAQLTRWQSRSFGPLMRRPLKRKVFTYYPYWGGDWTRTRFDLISSLSYFSVAINAMGDVTDRRGWNTATSRALVDEAKRWGVKVSLCASNFNDTQLEALLSSPARRTHAVDVLLREAQAGGAEGINIDFEFVPPAVKAEFVLFMQELANRFWTEIPGSEVSIAMPAIDWSAAYDYDQLAATTDVLFIMGYGYHWSGGAPGPLSPVTSAAPWGRYSLAWTVNDYVQNGGPNIRQKLVLGMPFYGYDWPATSSTAPSRRGTGSANSVVYRSLAPLISMHGRRWEPVTGTPYLVWSVNGVWHQLWYDDAESWRAKLDFADREGLGGVGMWALTYERGTTDLWDAFEEKLVVPMMPDAGVPEDAAAPDAEAEDATADPPVMDAAAPDALAVIDAGDPDTGVAAAQDATEPPQMDAEAPPSADASPTAADAGVAASTPDAAAQSTEEDEGGCGCTAGGRGRAEITVILLCAIAIRRTRRRRC